MLPDRVSNPGPLTYESGALPNALRGPALGPRSDLLAQTTVRGQIQNFLNSEQSLFIIYDVSA